MNRRSNDELRAKFLANREKVRSWIADWQCPEVEWPEFREIPLPWVVPQGGRQQWLKRHAPGMDAYQWLLEARPLAGTGVTHVRGTWWFGEGHKFERLEIELQCVADPAYLAEKLALGAHAAALETWLQEDLYPLHTWLFEGLDTRPIGQMVSGQNRTGRILFDLLRSPAPLSQTDIVARLTMSMTNTALDGSPLDADGRLL